MDEMIVQVNQIIKLFYHKLMQKKVTLRIVQGKSDKTG